MDKSTLTAKESKMEQRQCPILEVLALAAKESKMEQKQFPILEVFHD